MTEDNSEKYDSSKHKHLFDLSNTYFIFSSLIAIGFELVFILRVWMRPRQPFDSLIAFLVQILVLFPWISISALRFTIGKQMEKGGISPDFAKTLNLQLAILLMLVYLALMQIMNLSLR